MSGLLATRLSVNLILKTSKLLFPDASKRTRLPSSSLLLGKLSLTDKAGPLFAAAQKALKEHSIPRPTVPAYRTLDVNQLKAA